MGAFTPESRCTHWHVYPPLFDVQCTREAGHPRERNECHIYGAESWSDAAGEWRPLADPRAALDGSEPTP